MFRLFKSISFLFIAQACVGLNIVLSKGLVGHISPFVILAIRFSIASLFIFILSYRLLVRARFKFNLGVKGWLIICIEGIGAGVLFNFLMLSGLYYTDANSAGLITSALPMVVIVFGVALFGQKLNRKIIQSVALAVVGLILININPAGSLAKNMLLGNLLVFIALIPDAIYYVLSKYYPLAINSILKTLLLNAVNLPILYVILCFTHTADWQSITLHDWQVLVLIGVCSGLFFVFWQKGIERVDPIYSALSITFMPIATALLAWLILGEGLGSYKFLGMILVIFSIIIYSRK